MERYVVAHARLPLELHLHHFRAIEWKNAVAGIWGGLSAFVVCWGYDNCRPKPSAMTTCRRSHLEARCHQRGYTLSDVMPCVVSQNGDEWTIDVDHPAYPRVPKAGYEPPPPVLPAHGPGTELSKLLKRFGIEPTPTCACRAKAQEMDMWGPDECQKPERIAEVVAVMRAEAEARGLPFLDVAARLLVRHAIRNARKLGPPALPESS